MELCSCVLWYIRYKQIQWFSKSCDVSIKVLAMVIVWGAFNKEMVDISFSYPQKGVWYEDEKFSQFCIFALWGECNFNSINIIFVPS